METPVIDDCPTQPHSPSGGCADPRRYDPQQIDARKDLHEVVGSWLHISAAVSGFAPAASWARVRGICKLQDAMKAEV